MADYGTENILRARIWARDFADTALLVHYTSLARSNFAARHRLNSAIHDLRRLRAYLDDAEAELHAALAVLENEAA